LFYNIALLTFVKKLAFNCKKTSFFHSLQACARKVFPPWFSACQRSQNSISGYSVHLYSDKARCVNQSERALYRNFIIKLFIGLVVHIIGFNRTYFKHFKIETGIVFKILLFSYKILNGKS